MMKIYQAIKDWFLAFIVLFFISSKISHSFSYWWIALSISLFLMLPQFIELYRDYNSKAAFSKETD